jgi:hypothetical protein
MFMFVLLLRSGRAAVSIIIFVFLLFLKAAKVGSGMG